MIRALAISVLLAGYSFAATLPLETKYYQTGGDVVSAQKDVSDLSADIYKLRVLCKADTDTAVFYLPLPYNTDRVNIEWSAVASTADSVYIDMKYGSIFEVQQAETPIFYGVLQDSSLYWYKGLRQYSVTGPENLLSSRYFVVKIRGCSKLPAAGAYVTIKVTIPKKG